MYESMEWKKLKIEKYFVRNENQLDAVFILNLFRQSTSTFFGHNHCPSLGAIHCICTAASHQNV
jgi:hypothetical protein